MMQELLFFRQKVGSQFTSSESLLSTTRYNPFTSAGRLYQVEYAMEAISHAGTALGILASDGIVLAAEKKVTSKLLEQSATSEKIYLLNEYVFLLFFFA